MFFITEILNKIMKSNLSSYKGFIWCFNWKYTCFWKYGLYDTFLSPNWKAEIKLLSVEFQPQKNSIFILV